ncbi:hypothetical protein ACIA5D_35590 [Actinoplanes sp. NPDC051513]|uniref:hypothetical protein n=1 Tax=Actinoplanes sp. NPDC051513 TaxID=3363908 RepID=UPI003799F48B
MAQALMRDETMTGREIDAWILPGLPDTASETPHGVRVPAGARIDWVAQAEAACDAFGRNGFVMLTGDRQIDDLDELIDLRRDNEISFIRLIPLVGG